LHISGRGFAEALSRKSVLAKTELESAACKGGAGFPSLPTLDLNAQQLSREAAFGKPLLPVQESQIMLQALKTRIKQTILLATNQMSHLAPTIRSTRLWLGNDYGGFYVCPEFLSSNSIIYSIGVGEDISFDRKIIERFGCEVYAFDPTPKSIDWVAQQSLPENFHFFPIGIGDKTGSATFFLPRNADHVSGSFVKQENVDDGRTVVVSLQSFADMTETLGHSRVDVLKMDIEGGEYDVLGSILQSAVRPGQIVVEFHDRFFEGGKQKTIDAIDALRRHGYGLFAVSPTFEEVSFLDTALTAR
jgi:FkbM family methyltransferase